MRFIKLNWQFLVSALLLTVLGWVVVHYLTSERDRTNKLRDIRLNYLIGTYRSLALAVQRKPEAGSKYFRDMEAAIADIELFGTDKQIRKAEQFLKEFSVSGQASIDPLLDDLRQELRQELKLSKIDGAVRWFRPEGVPLPSPSSKDINKTHSEKTLN